MSLTESISQAIATMEGWYKSGSIAQRNNNPGNLRSWGSMPIVDGYAKFPTADAGWTALHRQVDLNISRGLSLDEFFGGKPGVYAGYSPAADSNRPHEYAVFVASRIGLDPSIPLNSVPLSVMPDNSQIADSEPIWDDPTMTGDNGVSEVGAVNWGLVGLVGVVLLAIWWASD